MQDKEIAVNPLQLMPGSDITVSIIVPVYFNDGSLRELHDELVSKVLSANPDLSFEMCFIDDGSGDNSLDVLKSLKEECKSAFKIIKLTRNFGQVNAIYAGLQNCLGDYAVILSADLQDPPEMINNFIENAINKDLDIVIAARQDRNESRYRVLTSRMFYWLMRKLTFKQMPLGGFDFCLITKRVINEILHNYEANPFLQGQILYTGFKTLFIPYKRDERLHGHSKWTFSKKIKMLIDGIISYSYLPVRVMTIMGVLISFSGFVYAILVVIGHIMGRSPFKGWTPIMILILVLSGIQMLMIGIIGEYLWRTLDQVRGRSRYIIDKIYD